MDSTITFVSKFNNLYAFEF
ncbi:hypothetical protein CCACVL1_17591 [Corchorus capsularis]|uniref:Uncharacterized protein n=1 Tax=Corchorus capsularis TaxID=210143 RepID=A0A1R3HRG2_COCAP|nr:hypothetical protein CCACVL1_17591 [Corchorus capsularis]